MNRLRYMPTMATPEVLERAKKTEEGASRQVKRALSKKLKKISDNEFGRLKAAATLAKHRGRKS